MRSSANSILSLVVACATVLPTTAADIEGTNWPAWRGDGSGVSRLQGAPLYWDNRNGIAWKTRIAGEGKSSPIVWHDRVFVTAATEGGRTRLVVCLDAKSGDTLWQTPLKAEQTIIYPNSSHAAPTPVTDGRQVYAFFDSPGLVALDFEGKVKWIVPLGPFNQPYTMAASPIVCGELVVVNCDQRDTGFIVGVDRVTGEERWRTKRQGGLHYTTPLSITHHQSRQIIVSGQTVVSYEPTTGKPLWSARELKLSTTPSPVYQDGLVYATSGRNGPSLAIDPGGSGDVTETHVRMYVATGGSYVPSPLVVGGMLLIPGDDGRVLLVDKSGKIARRHRLKGHFRASPVSCAGRIYWTDRMGLTHVIDAEKLTNNALTLHVLASNPLEEECVASPAIADGQIFLRTGVHLYGVIGGDVKLPPPTPIVLPDRFADLKTLFEDQPGGEFDDTTLRILIVEKLATMREPEAVDLLARISLRDQHWDVAEAAVKALGRHGRNAVSALLSMFEKGRPYHMTLAAEYLAEIKPPQAVATLSATALDVKGDRQVRVGAIKALGAIAAEHTGEALEIAETLLGLMHDEQGVIRLAVIESLVLFPKQVGEHHKAIVAELRRLEKDKNGLVADAARRAINLGF